MVLQFLFLTVALNSTAGVFETTDFYAPADIAPAFSVRTATDPSASVTPLATTTFDREDNLSSIGEATSSQDTRQRRRTNSFEDGNTQGTPDEPGTPVGDIPWGLILSLAALSALRLSRRRRATV